MHTRNLSKSADTLVRSDDKPQLRGVDFVEFHVGNTMQAAFFYQAAFGFASLGRAGLETGLRDRTSIVLGQQQARFVLTGALHADHPISEAIRRHGDYVKDVAFSVDDAAAAFAYAIDHGAVPVSEPEVLEDEHGRVVRASIQGGGDLVHTLIEREEYSGAFMPGFQPLGTGAAPQVSPFECVDHVAFSVERGTLDQWAELYINGLGFEQVFQDSTTTEYSSMRSKVVQCGEIRFTLLEPGEGRRKSQIEEYLSYHGGSGAQHVALLTQDIIAAVRQLKKAGVEFLKAPGTYYEMLPDRIGSFDEDVAALRELGILLDRDEWGYLLQIFSKPVHSRPTMFLEIIQRKQARGFGAGNIRALFQAVEREQTLRGNL
jgi:4-hydroxyphenylpyruvate dioxygenase